MRKINLNKICFLTLCSIGIGLGCFASALSLLTNNFLLEFGLLFLTYFLGIVTVRAIHKYKLFKD